MPKFDYLIKDSHGKDRTGIEEAPDSQTLVESLRRQGFLIVRINRVKESKMFSLTLTRKKGTERERGGKAKIDDFVVFARQLSTLIGAGVPLLESLDVLREQTEKTQFKKIVTDLHDSVRGGKSFSEALDKHIKVFSQLFVHMVRAGESSGHLEEILDRLAVYLEKSSALQKKIKSALTYPAVVASMAFLITGFMLTFVIPKFAEIFFSINAPLPAPTLIIISLSNFMQANFMFILGGMVLTGFLFKRWIQIRSGRRIWDRFKLKFPIFGPLLLKVSVSKFSRTMATLIKSGVPILSSLEIVARTVGNTQLEDLILGLRNSVTKGEGLSRPLSMSTLLPPMVVRMIAVGEETGELEKMLIKIADFYDTQVDSTVSALTSLIEPLVIAFLGIVIGGIVVSMFLPILTLTQAIH